MLMTIILAAYGCNARS